MVDAGKKVGAKQNVKKRKETHTFFIVFRSADHLLKMDIKEKRNNGCL